MTGDTQTDRNYSALVIGGTGAVGTALVQTLLESDRCHNVRAVVRRDVDLLEDHPNRGKLELLKLDYESLEASLPEAASGSAVAFSTMGIGQPRKVDPAVVYRVEVEHTGAFARGAVAAGAHHVSLLSSVGANATSRNRYLRVKGEAEQAVEQAGARRTSLFRPSVLATDDIRYGLQDRVTQAVFPLVSGLFPSRYHEIHVRDLGRAMVVNAETEGTGVEFLYYADYRRLLG